MRVWVYSQLRLKHQARRGHVAKMGMLRPWHVIRQVRLIYPASTRGRSRLAEELCLLPRWRPRGVVLQAPRPIPKHAREYEVAGTRDACCVEPLRSASEMRVAWSPAALESQNARAIGTISFRFRRPFTIGPPLHHDPCHHLCLSL